MEFNFNDISVPTNDQHLTAPNNEAEYESRNNVLVDGGNRFGVSAAVFDKFEELIWMGNQGGHVTSYYGPGMQKYTSFQVHATEEVRDIVTAEQGIYALTKTMLRHQIRRGIPKHTYRSQNMTDMQCLFQVGTTKLLMGGHQNKLLELDLTKMKETVIPIPEEGCAVLRSGGGSLVACGSASGSVVLRDLRSPTEAEHTFRAHTACLSDLDMQGDLLITCGFTQSPGAVSMAEPYVVVWDVRYLRGNKPSNEGAWTLPTASPPLLLHFLPVFSGRAVALSGDGHVALLHVNSSEGDEQSVFQVDTNSSSCTVMDVSATSQALLFGDQAGHLHLFSARHNQDPVFNNFSKATEFADEVKDIPGASFRDTKFKLSSVPLNPLSSGKWFNELPPEFFKKVYRKPKPIDPEVLKTMKMQGPIGYAPNPGTSRRNQKPYVEDNLEDLNTAKVNGNKFALQPVPRYYQKLDLRFNKHAPIDLDLESLNRTGFPGLEATLPNSYCNSMLQVLYYTPLLKATLLAHTCAKEFCLSCELGFLFRMLDTSGGAPCQAGNFLRAFRTVPEAAALGLIQPDRGLDPMVDLIALIQSWNRFILHQIHYEILETRKKESLLATANGSPNSRIGKNIKLRSMATPQVNGQYAEEFQYTELEFLGPSTEFDAQEGTEGKEGWHNHRQEKGVKDVEQVQNRDNHEMSNNHHADREESEISQLFAIGRHQLNRCLKCNKEEERESVVLACALQYPVGGSREGGEARGGFVELIRASLAARRSTPAWCDHCSRFTPTTQRGRIIRLPPILAINCGGVTAHEKAYWAKGLQKDMPEVTKRAGSGKPCRYGLHCARQGCRFKHPDRLNSNQASTSRSLTQDSHCVLPQQLVIRLQSDGDVMINDKSDQSPSESPTRLDNNNKLKKKHVTTQSEAEYSLSAAVVCVEDSPKNLVAYVQTAGKELEPHWYLFNDLSIIPVSADEVVQFSAWWKSPCVLFYTTSGARQSAGEDEAKS